MKIPCRYMGLVLLAGTVMTASAEAQAQAQDALARLGRSVGEASLVRKFCPNLDVNEQVRDAQMKSAGADVGNASFQQGVLEGVLAASRQASRNPPEFCKVMAERYGASGTVMRNLIKPK